MRCIIKKRASGILLHITCLPSKYGVGDLGTEAYKFADFLAKTRQSYWQVLPINPPAPVNKSWSPYNCMSAFAGNTLLISPDLLYQQGLLTREDIGDKPAFPKSYIDYEKVITYKTKLLKKACECFKNKSQKKEYEGFCLENKGWLEDFALFAALRQHFNNRLWCNWPKELRDRNKCDLISIRASLQKSIKQEKFLQYLFFKQWFALKDYCNQKNVKIIGDIPIYVAYDSSDVWANPEIFKLKKSKRPRFIAGVPPDLFSPTGQLWGNPVYNWKALKKTNFSWWVERTKHNLKLFDTFRLDHFRGFFGYWQVPAGSKTAAKGRWVKGPAEDFFNTLFNRLSCLPMIAEDLGYITPRIRAFMEKSNITGTRVLLFGFGRNPSDKVHFPDNYIKNSVVYTGTHDNNTIRGWFEKEADAEQKKRLFDYLGHKVTTNKIHWELINVAEESVANLVIIPMQDILGLGQEARMNRPGKTKGNWLWRLSAAGETSAGQITPQISRKLKRLTQINSRG
jgi:4-alpha-glucanotransferase